MKKSDGRNLGNQEIRMPRQKPGTPNFFSKKGLQRLEATYILCLLNFAGVAQW